MCSWSLVGIKFAPNSTLWWTVPFPTAWWEKRQLYLEHNLDSKSQLQPSYMILVHQFLFSCLLLLQSPSKRLVICLLPHRALFPSLSGQLSHANFKSLLKNVYTRVLHLLKTFEFQWETQLHVGDSTLEPIATRTMQVLTSGLKLEKCLRAGNSYFCGHW